MTTPVVSIAYHSGYGHTAVLAEAVRAGALEAGAEVHLINVAEITEEQWTVLDGSDAIVFGSPTYMGTASGPFHVFAEATSKRWFGQDWKDKLAAGFTNSGSKSGDKLHTLQFFQILAAQHGMHWINLGLHPGWNNSEGSEHDLNRLGVFAALPRRPTSTRARTPSTRPTWRRPSTSGAGLPRRRRCSRTGAPPSPRKHRRNTKGLPSGHRTGAPRRARCSVAEVLRPPRAAGAEVNTHAQRLEIAVQDVRLVAGAVHPGLHHRCRVGLAPGYVLAAEAADAGRLGPVPGVLPLGSVWSKKPSAAMASLKSSASLPSALFADTAVQPTFARSSFTSFSTSASACASADTVMPGAVVFCGALVAVREGVAFGSLLGVFVGFSVGVLVGAAVEAEADGVGEAVRSPSRLAASSSRPSSALPDVPPCSVAELVGVSAACTLSAPLPPPSL